MLYSSLRLLSTYSFVMLASVIAVSYAAPPIINADQATRPKVNEYADHSCR